MNLKQVGFNVVLF